jgi:hypothetical protein
MARIFPPRIAWYVAPWDIPVICIHRPGRIHTGSTSLSMVTGALVLIIGSFLCVSLQIEAKNDKRRNCPRFSGELPALHVACFDVRPSSSLKLRS